MVLYDKLFTICPETITELIRFEFLAWPPLQSLAVKKNFFFGGGEKLFKLVEKCR